MKNERKSSGIDRRQFLAATGGGLLAAAGCPAPRRQRSGRWSAARNCPGIGGELRPRARSWGASLRKIPIGVFDPVYGKFRSTKCWTK